jgi:predicted Zn-dependent protease
MMNRRVSFALLFVLALFISSFGMVERADAIMLVSEKMEISIGKDVAQQAEKEYGGVSTDANLNARVESIGRKLVESSDRKKLPYTFKVLNSKEYNAFACPGGPVYITKGLLDKLTTDDQLAFVLGHEISHIAKQHGRKAINKALMVNVLGSIFLSNQSEALQQGIGIAYTLISNGYSREQEYEADRFGTTYAMRAGYKGTGAVEALKVLMSATGDTGKASGLRKHFSTHPPTLDRIDRITKQLNALGVQVPPEPAK